MRTPCAGELGELARPAGLRQGFNEQRDQLGRGHEPNPKRRVHQLRQAVGRRLTLVGGLLGQPPRVRDATGDRQSGKAER